MHIHVHTIIFVKPPSHPVAFLSLNSINERNNHDENNND